jgi:hypothetical protein
MNSGTRRCTPRMSMTNQSHITVYPECRMIRDKQGRGKARGRFAEPTIEPAMEREIFQENLRGAFGSHNNLLHFCGHGTEDGTLLFDDVHGKLHSGISEHSCPHVHGILLSSTGIIGAESSPPIGVFFNHSKYFFLARLVPKSPTAHPTPLSPLYPLSSIHLLPPPHLPRPPRPSHARAHKPTQRVYPTDTPAAIPVRPATQALGPQAAKIRKQPKTANSQSPRVAAAPGREARGGTPLVPPSSSSPPTFFSGYKKGEPTTERLQKRTERASS